MPQMHYTRAISLKKRDGAFARRSFSVYNGQRTPITLVEVLFWD